MRASLTFWLLVASCAMLFGCALPGRRRIVLPETAIVYQPSGPAPAGWRPPGTQCEDAFFESADGVRLHGWFTPVDNPSAVVLLAHGNSGSVVEWQPYAKMLADRLQVSVLVFDYRGFGQSDGTPSERGLLADARAARAWLADRAGVDETDIVLLGRSLGGGVVVDLAAHDGARGVVLESTFTSLPDVANAVMPLPIGNLMLNRYASIKKIDQYHGPLLVVHGDADELIPYEQGERLFAAANEPKQFIALPGEGHNWRPTDEYLNKLEAFLTSLPSS